MDNFTEMYLDRVKAKRMYRKQNSKFAGFLNQVMQFSAAAVLCFLLLNSFVNINKYNQTFVNLAKVESKAVNSMPNLSDCTQDKAITQQSSKPLKTMPFSALSLISFGLFGIIKRKEGNMKTKTITRCQGEEISIEQYANFHKSGSIKGMKKLYYGKNATLLKCGNYIYNVPVEVYNQF